MGTEVLRPENCVIENIRTPSATSFYRRRNIFHYVNPCTSYNYNPRSSRKPVVRSEKQDQRRKLDRSEQSPSVSKKSSFNSDYLRSGGDLKMEKVVILRRGELLDSKTKFSVGSKNEGNGGLVACGTQRLGSGMEMVPKEAWILDTYSPDGTKSDVYAGSAFSFSPAPSSLPLPSFSKKQVSAIVDDSATRDLRRLLRLD